MLERSRTQQLTSLTRMRDNGFGLRRSNGILSSFTPAAIVVAGKRFLWREETLTSAGSRSRSKNLTHLKLLNSKTSS